MTSRTLQFTERALSDIERRAIYLAQERGTDFAVVWTDALITWLENLAETGAQLGTQHPSDARIRTFGYKRQATILAEFEGGKLSVIRVYFPGHDWSASPADCGR